MEHSLPARLRHFERFIVLTIRSLDGNHYISLFYYAQGSLFVFKSGQLVDEIANVASNLRKLASSIATSSYKQIKVVTSKLAAKHGVLV